MATDLRTYVASLPDTRRRAFASACKTSVGHLKNVMYGFKSCATDLAVRIERESGKAVRRWSLRPTDWYDHWPELIGTDGAPPVPAEAEARDAA